MNLMYSINSLANSMASRTIDNFFKEVARQCDCKMTGINQQDFIKERNQQLWDEATTESDNFTSPVFRFALQNADRIKQQRIAELYLLKLHYGENDPDWIIGLQRCNAKEINRKYKLCRWIGDFHVNTNMIGAGSVVTKDVPDYGLVYGNTAKLKGKVNETGLVIR